MSNRVYIDEVNKPGSDCPCGYYAYDSYDECMAFNWEKTPDDDLEWFFDILTNERGVDDKFIDMIAFAKENQKAVTIRGVDYEWSDLEPVYQKAQSHQKAQG